MSDQPNPYLRDCPMCHAKEDGETILFTMEVDVVHGFAYSYTVRCCSCGVQVNDEYQDEAVRLWNGELRPQDEDEQP